MRAAAGAPRHGRSTEERRSLVVRGLRAAVDRLPPGVPGPELEGSLIRPLVALAGAPESAWDSLPDGFWDAALALQMVHEASLLHDDILDEASVRRGRSTLATRRGVGAALVKGDHLLTGAYRLIARTGCAPLTALFARAVERTVAGEVAQASSVGKILDFPSYHRTISSKSGELVGFALAVFPSISGSPGALRAYAAGRRLGAFYQMVDDALDYCRGAERGKPPLQDFRQRKWTWLLGEAGVQGFDVPVDEVLARLFAPGTGGCPPATARVLARLRREARRVRGRCASTSPGDAIVPGLVDHWLALTGSALAGEERSRSPLPSGPFAPAAGASRGAREPAFAAASVSEAGGPRGRQADVEPRGWSAGVDPRDPSAVAREAAAVGGEAGWERYFARHSRTFRFASRALGKRRFRDVAALYAFCRFTDDLADATNHPTSVRAGRLEAWLSLARDAYAGTDTGIPFLEAIMERSREGGVPFRYAEELVAGVAMDLAPRRYESLPELRVYSFRVASVVGMWMTELAGVHAPPVLQRAEALGHAMQLTNILRDVGEDLRVGRLYLPLDRLRAHRIDPDELLEWIARGLPPGPAYRALMEELMAVADRDYARALEAVGHLPGPLRRAVAIAARVYQGIHGAIRRNGYDNLSRRAWVSLPRKVALAGRGLAGLATVRPAWMPPQSALGPATPGIPLPGEERANA